MHLLCDGPAPGVRADTPLCVPLISRPWHPHRSDIGPRPSLVDMTTMPPRAVPARPADDTDPAGPGEILARLRPTDPRWATAAFAGLLLGTAVLYFWNLTVSGYANEFYAAAAQAGAESWKAFFFGSLDAGNAITVDKPPASLWFMAISVRILGLSSFSILLPQVLMGVATVAVVARSVRRHAGIGAGLLAGLAMALTPVAVLMFRFDNPDALLVLLMTLAAAATLRAIEKGSVRWMAVVGVLIGFAFLTKTLQAFLVVPFFGLAWVLFAATTLRRRILGALAAVAALAVAGGWWVAVVELVPESWRPYVGGSQNDSFLELTFGYNGFGRLTGDETGSVGGGGGNGGGGWGSTGILRMFGDSAGGQISWLLPAALLLLVAGLVLRGRAPRTDLRRAALVVWGGWLVVTMLVFSFMAGIFHDYYTVALAPAIAAVVGLGGAELWERRGRWWARVLLALAIAGTGGWGAVLLVRTGSLTWLAIVVAAAGMLAGAGVLLAHRLRRGMVVALAALALVAAFAGQAAFAVDTVSTAKTGSIVTAGPASQGGMGGGPGGGMGGGQGGPGGQGGQGGQGGPGGQTGQGQGGPGGQTGQTGQTGQMPSAPGGQSQGQTGGQTGQSPSQGQTGQMPSMGGGQEGMTGGGGGGMGGLLDGAEPSEEVVDALLQDADQYTWVAATIGSQNAAALQLATEEPVMAIGGFNGSDPSPTLAEFQRYVADGEIHYLAASSGIGGQQNGGADTGSEIQEWAAENYETVTIGDSQFYDLTQPLSSTTDATGTAS